MRIKKTNSESPDLFFSSVLSNGSGGSVNGAEVHAPQGGGGFMAHTNPTSAGAPPVVFAAAQLAPAVGVESLISRLVMVCNGRLQHIYNGDCPETWEEIRDPKCPACQVLIEAAHYCEQLEKNSAKP